MTIKQFEIKRQELARELETLFTEYRTLYPTVHPKVTDFLHRIEEQAREDLYIDTFQKFYDGGFYELTTGRVIADWMQKHDITYDDIASLAVENMMTSTDLFLQTEDGVIKSITIDVAYIY